MEESFMTQEHLQQIAKDPKEYLNRCYRAEERIGVLKERIGYWQEQAESISITIQPAVAYSSTPSKKVEKSVCNIIDLKAELEEEVNEILAMQRSTAEAIKELIPDIVIQMLFQLRYLRYLPWEEIAERLKYSYRWTLRLHKQTLNEIKASASQKLECYQLNAAE